MLMKLQNKKNPDISITTFTTLQCKFYCVINILGNFSVYIYRDREREREREREKRKNKLF